MVLEIADAGAVIADLIEPTFRRTDFRHNIEARPIFATDAARIALLVIVIVEARPIFATDTTRIALLIVVIVEARPILASDTRFRTLAIIVVIVRIG